MIFTGCMIHPEEEIAALLFPETIPQWQFHSHMSSTSLLRQNTTLAEKQRWSIVIRAASWEGETACGWNPVWGGMHKPCQSCVVCRYAASGCWFNQHSAAVVSTVKVAGTIPRHLSVWTQHVSLCLSQCLCGFLSRFTCQLSGLVLECPPWDW